MSRFVLLLLLLTMVVTAGGAQGCWWLWSKPFRRLSDDELGKKYSSVVLLRLRITDETGRYKGATTLVSATKRDVALHRTKRPLRGSMERPVV